MPIPSNPSGPKPNNVQATAKAQSSGDPNQMIDRKLVAGALDRGLKPDGVIADAEFQQAGIRLDADARAIVNRLGEAGDAITVNELATALGQNTVAITGEGNVQLVDGYATVPNGRLQASGTWLFPDLPGLRSLARIKDLAPTLGDGLNPDSPGSRYIESQKRYIGTYHAGETLRSGEYVADSSGYEVRPGADGAYPAGSQVWQRYDVVEYDDMAYELENRARQILSETSGSNDAELRQIQAQVQGLLSGWSLSDEARARRLYSGLQTLGRIEVPDSPRTRMSHLDDSVNAAKSAIEDHVRILQQVPLERARQAVARELMRRESPTTTPKLAGAAVGGVVAGGGVFSVVAFGGVAMAGGTLALAVAGAAVVGLGLGWLVGKLIDRAGAKSTQEDLRVLETINPEKNQQELNQHALQAYKLLQDGRTVSTLAKLRAFDEDAKQVQRSVDAASQAIRSQAASMREIEHLVGKYGV